MRRLILLAVASPLLLLALVVMLEALGLGWLDDPSPWLREVSPVVAVFGVGLLVVDVLLPVPSSLVMVLNGSLFGPLVGTALSVAGSLGAALAAFGLGRLGGPLVDRVLTPDERAVAAKLLERWGTLTVLVTRPVPLLAESTAMLAGAMGLPLERVSLAALVGTLPAALLYAVVGWLAWDMSHWTIAFALVLPLAGAYYLAGRWLSGRLQQ